jgi:tRNA pseudouridine32 synthase/23S rRNA pseudouridine746 synthase
MLRHTNGVVHIVSANPIASRLQLPPGQWVTVLDGLCARFPAIARESWMARFGRGRVLDGNGHVLTIDTPYRVGMEVRYFREVADEAVIPFAETVLYTDDDLVVADKPHFLPVMPAGGHVRETLLSRLQRRLDNVDLVPLHRIDRDTAGLVMFSAQRGTRAAYQDLFRLRRIEKSYEALAPALQQLVFPMTYRSRIEPGTPFFRMHEALGDANSETRIDVIERGPRAWRYELKPVTGRKHQLRVQMAALGAPILGDALYPHLQERALDDYSQPLQLLAKTLVFVDPLSGETRRFDSRFSLPSVAFSRAEDVAS